MLKESKKIIDIWKFTCTRAVMMFAVIIDRLVASSWSSAWNAAREPFNESRESDSKASETGKSGSHRGCGQDCVSFMWISHHFCPPFLWSWNKEKTKDEEEGLKGWQGSCCDGSGPLGRLCAFGLRYCLGTGLSRGQGYGGSKKGHTRRRNHLHKSICVHLLLLFNVI